MAQVLVNQVITLAERGLFFDKLKPSLHDLCKEAQHLEEQYVKMIYEYLIYDSDIVNGYTLSLGRILGAITELLGTDLLTPLEKHELELKWVKMNILQQLWTNRLSTKFNVPPKILQGGAKKRTKSSGKKGSKGSKKRNSK
jgi:hypothetical protein